MKLNSLDLDCPLKDVERNKIRLPLKSDHFTHFICESLLYKLYVPTKKVQYIAWAK